MCQYRQLFPQRAGLGGGNTHTLSIFWVEPAARVGHRQQTLRKRFKALEMPTQTLRKSKPFNVPDQFGIANGIVNSRCAQSLYLVHKTIRVARRLTAVHCAE